MSRTEGKYFTWSNGSSAPVGVYSFGGTDLQVSDRAHGTRRFREWLGAFHGKSIRAPQRPDFYPEPRFTAWHVREVFQGEARLRG